MGSCSSMEEGAMFCVLDDIAVVPAVKQKLQGMKISTFPYVTIDEFDTAFDSVQSVDISRVVRARLDQTLRSTVDRDGRLNVNAFARNVSEGARKFDSRQTLLDASSKLGFCLCVVAPLFTVIVALLVGGMLSYFEGWCFRKGVWVAIEELTLTNLDLSGDEGTVGDDDAWFGILGKSSGGGGDDDGSEETASGSSGTTFTSPASKAVAALASLWCLAFTAALLGTIGGPLLSPVLAWLGLLPLASSPSHASRSTATTGRRRCRRHNGGPDWWGCVSDRSCSGTGDSEEDSAYLVEGVDVASVRDPQALILRTVLKSAARVEELATALASTQHQLDELMDEVMEQHGREVASVRKLSSMKLQGETKRAVEDESGGCERALGRSSSGRSNLSSGNLNGGQQGKSRPTTVGRAPGFLHESMADQREMPAASRTGRESLEFASSERSGSSSNLCRHGSSGRGGGGGRAGGHAATAGFALSREDEEDRALRSFAHQTRNDNSGGGGGGGPDPNHDAQPSHRPEPRSKQKRDQDRREGGSPRGGDHGGASPHQAHHDPTTRRPSIVGRRLEFGGKHSRAGTARSSAQDTFGLSVERDRHSSFNRPGSSSSVAPADPPGSSYRDGDPIGSFI